MSAKSSEAGVYQRQAAEYERTGDLPRAREFFLRAAETYVAADKVKERGENIKHATACLERARLLLTFIEEHTGQVPAIVVQAPPPMPPTPASIPIPQLPPEPRKIAPITDEEKKNLPDFVLVELPDITLEDVIGMGAIKQIIKETLVYPFTRPDLYKTYGKATTDAVLMYGPPGCGKTYIAKAAAGEGNATFLFVMPHNILKSGEGETERNIVHVFDIARKHSPSVIYFDEFDSIANKKRLKTVNVMLAQMDGLEEKPEKCLILAATNKPWNIAPALRRSGRFSKLIHIPPPDLEMRAALFQKGCNELPVDSSVRLATLAGLTEWYSCADIAEVVGLARDIPLREALAESRQARRINAVDFTAALTQKKSTLPPWFGLAKQEIIKSGEEDVFKDIMQLIKNYDKWAASSSTPISLESKSSGSDVE